jgi:hypothetical protein
MKLRRREKMKRTILLSIVALAVAAAFVSTGLAQQSSPTPTATAPLAKMEKFNGVIVKVDEANKDAGVQFHKEKMTFSFSDQTKIFEGSKALTFNDLKKGLWASIEYRKEGNKLVADTVHVSMPMVAKKENPSEKAIEQK